MHWVLSTNIFHEPGWDLLTETLRKFEISFSEHKIIPFVGELLPDLPADFNNGNCIVIGPYSMRHVALKKSWHPGSFDLESFDFTVQNRMWPGLMLNADSTVQAFQDALWNDNSPRFVRPILDSKSFTGAVFEHKDFADWQHRVCVLDENTGQTITAQTIVQVSCVKKIYSEYRCWVVDGSIVTMSMYRLGTKIHYRNADAGEFDTIREYAQTAVDLWQPSRAFVLDVCVIPGENNSLDYRIVEINTINACGFYACDMQKLVMALQQSFSDQQQ